MKNKSFFAVMIVVWSVIIIALIGLLTYLCATKEHTPIFNFISNYNSDVGGTSQNYTKSYDISGINNIDLDLVNADINYSASDSDKIEVTVKSDNKSQKIDTDLTNGSLSVKEDCLIGLFNFNFGFHNSATVTINVPYSYKNKLTFKTVSGDIKVIGNLDVSSADIKTTSGDISTDSIKANNVSFLSISGDIKSKEITGSYSFKTTSGNAVIGSLSGNGSIVSTSGDINCTLEKLDDTFKISTVSGSQTIGIKDTIPASVSISTVSGEIQSVYPMTSTNKDHNAKIEIGSGSNAINATSVSGDISILK